jgi:catechol 2,3-dioxygenase-like lactoylglutathione lyase family enzyme
MAFTPGHIALNVTDLSRSTAFYRTVFAFDVVAERTDGDRRFAFLGQEGALVLTLWEQSAGTFAIDRPGLHHLSFEVADIDAVRRSTTGGTAWSIEANGRRSAGPGSRTGRGARRGSERPFRRSRPSSCGGSGWW